MIVGVISISDISIIYSPDISVITNQELKTPFIQGVFKPQIKNWKKGFVE